MSPSKRRSMSSSHPTTPKNNKKGATSTSKSTSTNLDSPRSRTPKNRKQIPGQLTIDEMFKAHKFKQSPRAQSCTSPEKKATNSAQHGSEKAEMVTLRRSKSQSNIPALASSSIRGLPTKSGNMPQDQSEPNRDRITSLVLLESNTVHENNSALSTIDVKALQDHYYTTWVQLKTNEACIRNQYSKLGESPAFLSQHEMYLQSLNEMAKICEGKIHQAHKLGESNISGAIDIISPIENIIFHHESACPSPETGNLKDIGIHVGEVGPTDQRNTLGERMETPFSKKRSHSPPGNTPVKKACTVEDLIGLEAQPLVSSKEDTQTPEIGQSDLNPTKISSPTPLNQNTSDSPLIHSTPHSTISCNVADEEKHGRIPFFQPLGGQLDSLDNSTDPEGGAEPSPYPCAQPLPEIHSTGSQSTNQYLKSPNQEPVELALTLTPTNPEEAPSGRLPPWLRLSHREQQVLVDLSNLTPSISQAGETPTTPTTPTSPKSPQHNVTQDNTLDTSNIPFELTNVRFNSESVEKRPDYPTSDSTLHSSVTPKSLASHLNIHPPCSQSNLTPKNRLAAQQLYESRKESRKIQQAKKLGVEATLLDPYDLYSDPVWLGDILAEARQPLSLELHSCLTNQKQVLLELIGNTRMEFGWYAKEMLDTITSTILRTLNANEESNNPNNILFIDGGKWSLLQDAMADLKQFGAILRQCPRLLQISQAHPYFNNQHLKMDIISKPIDIKLGGDFRSGSWFSLNLLTCGSSTSSWPDPKSDFARRMENSINRLIQIGGDSGRAVHKNVKPSKPSKSQTEKDKESNGRSAAKNYLLLKLTAMGACMKATSETSHHEGLPYLLQKIFEMFLGIVMIHEGYSIIDLEKKGSPQYPKANNKRGGAMVRDTLKLGYRIAQTDNETDGNEEKSEAWTELKQRSIGVLVLFLTFGVQGWFGCFQNRKKYTYRDIYSLMTMAHDMAINEISILSPSADGIHTPWYNLNTFLAETLASAGIGSGTIDWYQALVVWDSILDEASVANCFLLDLFQEIRFPGQSLCLSNLKVPPNLTTETVKASWIDLINKVCIPLSDCSGAIKYFHCREPWEK